MFEKRLHNRRGSGFRRLFQGPHRRNPVARNRHSRGSRIRLPFLTASLVLLLSDPVPAAESDLPPVSSGSVFFVADVGTALDAKGRHVARVFLELPYQSLRFTRSGREWTTSFDLTIVLYGKRNEQMTGDIWTVPLKSPTDPADGDVERVYRRQFEFPIQPGKMRVEINIQQGASGRGGLWTYLLEVPDYTTRPLSISDYEFGLCVPDSLETEPGWGEPGYIPWTRRRYGRENPIACIRGHVYDHLDLPDSTYQLSCQVLNASGRTVQTWTEVIPRTDGHGSFQVAPSTAGLSLGAYRLKVEAQLGREKVRRERWFEMDESRVNILEDPRMIRTVLGYIALNDEILKLKDLPADSLQSFWDAFWTRRDPSPGTVRNERLTEFLRRLEHVNESFSVLEPGWSSDMGHVYIRYGAPDEIDRSPYSNAGPPREVWYYQDRRLTFVFVDVEGFGRFRLVGSNGQ